MIKSLARHYTEMTSNKRSGFTLMELVVVIGVMAILALVMVPNLTAYIQKADDAKNKANMKSVHTAAELAVQSNPNIYTKDIAGLGATATGSKPSKSELIAEIAGYANLGVAEIGVPASGGPMSAQNVYFIKAEGAKLTVTYHTDRATYVFDGKEFK